LTEWQETTLGALIESGEAQIQTGPFGSQLHAHDYVTRGTSVIPTEAIGRRLIRDVPLPQVSAETAARLARHRLRAGDILFARRGIQATGLSALVTSEHAGALCGTGAIVLRLNSDALAADFASFWLASVDMFEWIRARAVGAVMPNLNSAILRQLPLVIPPREEQRAIVALLGSLDDKLALNRRMNHTLEATAEALFRSWFVDFDPVLSKAEGGRASGVPDAAQRVMPTALVDSVLGPIPMGWCVETIGSLVRCVGGGTPSTLNASFWNEGAIRWATPRDLAALEFPVIIDTERRITAAGVQEIGSGLLPRGTVLLSSRAPIGYLAVTAEPMAVNQGFIAMVCDGALPNWYVLHWVRENMESIVSRANGTTFMEINKRNFRPIPALRPPPEVLNEFVRIVEPLHLLIERHVRESLLIGNLRDMLLPQLLSGAMRLRDAERVVAEVSI